MRRVLLPAVLALAAALCAVAGLDRPALSGLLPAGAGGSPGSAGAAGSPGSGGGGEPILDVARVRGLVARLGAEQRLGTAIGAVLASAPAAAMQACVEVDDGGVAAYARNVAAPLIPASNLKLLTAAAALARLGPGATFTTTVAAASPPVGGKIAGPLYLVGGGDPLLATDDYRATLHQWTENREPITRLAAVADAVKAAGVTSIAGGVVGDDGRYDDQRTVPTWSPSYLADGEIAPVGALVVDGATTVARRRRVPVADPAASAAVVLAGLLAERGITVGGPDRHGTVPAGATPIASVESPPLTTVLGEMLRESDNLAAEMLIKELGHRFGGGGTWAAGTAVVHATLEAAGVPLAGVVQADGSGLDRTDRVPCRTLAAVVATGVLEPELPVAARCGTLVGRLVGRPGGGRVVAKTGSLSGVSALSGAVSSAPLPAQPCPPAGAAAGRVTFSVVFNGGTSVVPAEALEDRIADLLATYAGGA